MTETSHPTIFRKDYTAPDYSVDSINLRFELGEECTLVAARMVLRAQYDVSKGKRPLVLNGKHLTLLELAINRSPLHPECYCVNGELLTINDVPDLFTLDVITELRPQENTALEGLY